MTEAAAASATPATTTVMNTLPDAAKAEGAQVDLNELPQLDGAAAKEAPATEEPAKPEPAAVDATALAIAKRFEAAKQADIRARKADMAAKARLSEAEKREKDIAAREAKIKEAEALLNDDPIAWADSRKVDPDTLAKRYLNPLTPAEKELREIRARLDADDKAKKERDESTAKQRAEAQHHAQMRSFVSEITPDECPHLTALYEAREVPALVQRVLEEHGPAFVEEYGRNPTNQEIRAYLEHLATERAKKITARQSASESQPSSGVSGQLNNGSGHPVANGPGTLTNNHAAQAASGKTVPKTREERRAALIAQLEAEEREAKRSPQ